MRLRICLLAVLICAMCLSGCVFPLQRVSPDPLILESDAPEDSDSAVYTLPDLEPAPASSENSSSSSSASLSEISEPKLAVFWYAMADAHVFDLREAFHPVLDASEIPYREYDAENDRYRQLDQVSEAVSGGWNVLAIQMVSGDAKAMDEIIDAAGGCPVIFFDRTPEPEQFSSASGAPGNCCMIHTDPAEAGRVQGRMIGEFLISHFTAADLNQDGQIRYTFLVGDVDDLDALVLTHSALEEANALLAENGYRELSYLDEDNSIGFQADPSGTWSSDAGHSLILSDLSYYNYANSNMIELIAANNDDMALGALTALQSAWCNLGDGNVVTIPLFGLGASAAARSAVNLGQMTGTVDLNAAGYAEAVLSAVHGLTDGVTPESVFSELSAASEEFTCAAGTPRILNVVPRAVLAPGL